MRTRNFLISSPPKILCHQQERALSAIRASTAGTSSLYSARRKARLKTAQSLAPAKKPTNAPAKRNGAISGLNSCMQVSFLRRSALTKPRYSGWLLKSGSLLIFLQSCCPKPFYHRSAQESFVGLPFLKTRTLQPDVNDLRIASPCTAEWDAMTGDNRVRHCALCHLNVYNISEMTTREIRNL